MSKSVIELIVEATPTDVDDQWLANIQDMRERYPFLESFLLDMLLKMIARR